MARTTPAPYAKPYNMVPWDAPGQSWLTRRPDFGRRVSDVTLEGVSTSTSFLMHSSGWETPSKQEQRRRSWETLSHEQTPPAIPEAISIEGMKRRSLSNPGRSESSSSRSNQKRPSKSHRSSRSETSTTASTVSISHISKDHRIATGPVSLPVMLSHRHDKKKSGERKRSSSAPRFVQPSPSDEQRSCQSSGFKPLPGGESRRHQRSRPASRG